MSYDVTFRVKVQDKDTRVDIYFYPDCLNITWNVGVMIRKSTGLKWESECGHMEGYAKDIIPHITEGLSKLLTEPEKYKRYESPNGWGTINGCVRFFQEILSAWQYIVDTYPELIDVIEFWII